MFDGHWTYEGCVGYCEDVEDVEVVCGSCVVSAVVVVVGGGNVEDAYVGCVSGLVTKGMVIESLAASVAFCCFVCFRSFLAVFSISESIGSRIPVREDLGIKLLVMTRPRQRRQFVKAVKPNKR